MSTQGKKQFCLFLMILLLKLSFSSTFPATYSKPPEISTGTFSYTPTSQNAIVDNIAQVTFASALMSPLYDIVLAITSMDYVGNTQQMYYSFIVTEKFVSSMKIKVNIDLGSKVVSKFDLRFMAIDQSMRQKFNIYSVYIPFQNPSQHMYQMSSMPIDRTKSYMKTYGYPINFVQFMTTFKAKSTSSYFYINLFIQSAYQSYTSYNTTDMAFQIQDYNYNFPITYEKIGIYFLYYQLWDFSLTQIPYVEKNDGSYYQKSPSSFSFTNVQESVYAQNGIFGLQNFQLTNNYNLKFTASFKTNIPLELQIKSGQNFNYISISFFALKLVDCPPAQITKDVVNNQWVVYCTYNCQDPFCKVCPVSNSVCTQCVANYRLSTTGTCYQCQCEDGNLIDGDGCNSDCTLGNKNGCPKSSPFLDPKISAPTCISSCPISYYPTSIYTCSPCSVGCQSCSSSTQCTKCLTNYQLSSGKCTTVCGDGILLPPQICDDGNTVDGDGCNRDCTLGNNNGCPKQTPYIIGIGFQTGLKDQCFGILNCVQGRWSDYTNYRCQPCDIDCQTCTGPNACTDCILDNQEVVNGVCVGKLLPSGKYSPSYGPIDGVQSGKFGIWTSSYELSTSNALITFSKAFASTSYEICLGIQGLNHMVESYIGALNFDFHVSQKLVNSFNVMIQISGVEYISPPTKLRYLAISDDIRQLLSILILNVQLGIVPNGKTTVQVPVTTNFVVGTSPKFSIFLSGFRYRSNGLTSCDFKFSCSLQRSSSTSVTVDIQDLTAVTYPTGTLRSRRASIFYYDSQIANRSPYPYYIRTEIYVFTQEISEYSSPPEGIKTNMLGMTAFRLGNYQSFQYQIVLRPIIYIDTYYQISDLTVQIIVFRKYSCPPSYSDFSSLLLCNPVLCTDTNCLSCPTNVQTCSNCKFGFYIQQSDSTCISCSSVIPSCANCNSDPPICTQCSSDLFSLAGGKCVPKCGDGTKDAAEQCQDGNRVDGDGCNDDCTLGNNNSCPKATPFLDPLSTTVSCIASCPDGYYGDASYLCQPCKFTCGTCADNLKCLTCDASTNRELSVDQCVPKAGFYEAVPSTRIAPACGPLCATCSVGTACLTCITKYYLSAGKCLACSTISRCVECKPTAPAFCTVCAAGYYPDAKGLCTVTLCGDKVKITPQVCDNGNVTGCLNCQRDLGYTCVNSSTCIVKCADSKAGPGEQCDNGNKTGCTNCTQQPGYSCTFELDKLSVCTPVCGDGIFTAPELCDNGNKPGCSFNCTIDAGYSCLNVVGKPSKCYLCGNGFMEYKETCDTNNTLACINCVIQPGWICVSAMPSRCYRTPVVCGNGERELTQQCDDGNLVAGDGCGKTCRVEASWVCKGHLGSKSTCVLIESVVEVPSESISSENLRR